MYLSVKSKKLILSRLEKFLTSLPWEHIKPNARTIGYDPQNGWNGYAEDNNTKLTEWITVLRTDSPDISKYNWIQIMQETNMLYRQIHKRK